MISEGTPFCDDVEVARPPSPFELLNPGTDGTFSSFAAGHIAARKRSAALARRRFLLRPSPAARQQRPRQCRFQALHKLRGTERAAAVRAPPDCLALPFELRRRQELAPLVERPALRPRGEVDPAVPAAAQVNARARPRKVRRIADHSGADRIAFDIAQGRPQMVVVHRAGVVPALPDVSRSSPAGR